MAGGRWNPVPKPMKEVGNVDRGTEYEGEAGSDSVEDLSSSASRHACEQYAPPFVCRSQARQKSWVQSISIVSVEDVIGVLMKRRRARAR